MKAMTQVHGEELDPMEDHVTIYQADPDATIERLAELDSSRCPRGPVLVAAVAGEPRAALPLDGGPAVADPFHFTAELVSLLETRAAQLNGRSSRQRLVILPAWFRHRRQSVAQASGALPAAV
jgi:hypothetical protein